MSNEISNYYRSILPAVTEILYGPPKKKGSKEWRYGTNGSLCVDVEKGVWKYFESNVGGGVRDLIAHTIKGDNRAVNDWLNSNGFSLPTNQPIKKSEEKLIAVYDYVNELGEIIYQVRRFELTDGNKKKKTFRQNQIGADGKLIYNLKGVESVPYRLPELLEAIQQNHPIFIVEGEKDADTLAKHGVIATTNSGGASNWPDELNRYFKSANVFIVPDNDDAGRRHAEDIAKNLNGIASSIKLLNIPNLPEKGDVSDYFNNGGSIEEFNSFVESIAIPYSGEEIFKSKFGAIPWAHLDDPGLEHEWLIKNILTRGERSMVAGPSQSGKSFAVLDMALSVARGEDFKALAQIGGEGNFQTRTFKTRRGGVVYQAGEGGRGIKKRLRAYRKHHNLAERDLPFVLLPHAVDLHSNEEQTQQLIDEINHWASTYDCPLELVVIDTLSAATPGANENSSEDVSRILARCERIASLTGAHVMFVHHMNAQGEKPRGHTSIFANLDNVLTVRRTEDKEPPHDNKMGRDIREIILTKSKDGEDGTIIKFVLESIHLGEDEDNEPITSCVCVEPKGLSNAQQRGEKPFALNDHLMLGFRAFIKAVENHGEKPPENLKFPQHLQFVSIDKILSEYSNLNTDAQLETDQAKKDQILQGAFAEVLNGLLAKGVIAKHEHKFFYTGKAIKGFAYLRKSNTPKPISDLYRVEETEWPYE